MGACISCCERVLRISGQRRTASIRPVSVSDSFRAEIETTPVLADEAPLPLSKFSDKPPGSTEQSPPPSEFVPIYIDANMSSPTIKIGGFGGGDEEEGLMEGRDRKKVVSGHGLALVDTCVGQDGAYWEWHVGESDHSGGSGKGKDHNNVMVGVSTKRTQDFYRILAESDGAASSLKLATKLMRTVISNPGDTIGVAIDLSSATPFVKLLLNGELKEEFVLGRFRGSVFPSIWLPKPDGTAMATFVVDEANFCCKSPGPIFLPMSVASARGGSIA